jgi:hypothetical protein
LDEKLKWKRVKRLVGRLIMYDKQNAMWEERRLNHANEHQEHLLSIYFLEFDAVQYEDMESGYLKSFHNKFVKHKIQSVYNNYEMNIIIHLHILQNIIKNINNHKIVYFYSSYYKSITSFLKFFFQFFFQPSSSSSSSSSKYKI